MNIRKLPISKQVDTTLSYDEWLNGDAKLVAAAQKK